MCHFSGLRITWFASAVCILLLSGEPVRAQQLLTVTALNDKPGFLDGIEITIRAIDVGVGFVFATLSWDANDNMYSDQSIMLSNTPWTLRFTLRDDCCGSNGAGNCGPACTICDPTGQPDCDRIAAIDSFVIFGILREGEDFDRTGPPNCATGFVSGKTAVVCGQEGAFVEYDVFPAPLKANGYPQLASKNKYISFTPNPAAAGLPHGYQVTHVDSGRAWYISTPRMTPTSVIGENLAFLVGDNTPPIFDFGTLPVVHIGGCDIAPGESFEIRATDGLNFSVPLDVTTTAQPTNGRHWSDVVGAFSVLGNIETRPNTPPLSWEPPNGAMNGFDITAVLRGTDSGDPTRPHITWTDIDGGPSSVTNRATNGNDVLRAVNAFATGTGREFYATDHPDVGGAGCPICDPVTSGPCGIPPLESAIAP